MFSEANSISGQLIESGSPPEQPFVAGMRWFASKALGLKVLAQLFTVCNITRVAGARGQGAAQGTGR